MVVVDQRNGRRQHDPDRQIGGGRIAEFKLSIDRLLNELANRDIYPGHMTWICGPDLVRKIGN